MEDLSISNPERKRTSEALRESEEYFKAIIQNSSDIVLILDKLGTITYASPSVERFLGYGPDELMGKRSLDLIVSDDKPRAIADFGRALLIKELLIPNVFRIRHKNGTERILEGFGKNLLDNPVVAGFVMNVRDITERNQTETALRESEERLRDIIFSIADWVWEVDENGVYTYSSQKGFDLFGESRGDIIGKTPFDFMPPDEAKRVAAIFSEIVANKAPIKDLENLNIRRNGERIYFLTNGVPILDEEGNLKGYRGVDKDITERMQAEEALRESEKKYRVIAENMTDVIAISDMNMRFTFISPSVMRLRGFTVEEAMEQNIEQVMTPESMLRAYRTYEEEMQLEASGTADPDRVHIIELEECRKDMSTVWVEVSLSFLRDADGRPIGMLSLTRNIDARKRAEEALRESQAFYHSLVEQLPAGVFRKDREGRFVFVSPWFCQLKGMNEEEFLGKTPQEVIASEAAKPIASEQGTKYATEGADHHIQIMQTGNPIELVEEYTADAAGRKQFVHAIKIPVFNSEGKIIGTQGILFDITEGKRTEKQLRESLEQLRRAMQTTIQVLVMAVEMKDPYTAGHQRRMTNLARTMATEMGLPPEKIEGLRMAGVIHDIGKITLPTEILSKPTKLSAIEFSLLKEHVRLGYDILKDVESPWPLAEIVLQHHERMDGSGYPRGIKGEEILIEARILAVADVVEAMASHRPYRPALGLEAAMEEIEKNRGFLYDSHVVDTCLRVFREKGYQIEGT